MIYRYLLMTLIIILCGSLSFAEVSQSSLKEDDFKTRINNALAALKASTERAAQKVREAHANMRSSWERSRRNRDAAKSRSLQQRRLSQRHNQGNQNIDFHKQSNEHKQQDLRNKIRETNDRVDQQNQKIKAAMAQARSRHRDNSRSLRTQLRQR